MKKEDYHLAISVAVETFIGEIWHCGEKEISVIELDEKDLMNLE